MEMEVPSFVAEPRFAKTGGRSYEQPHENHAEISFRLFTFGYERTGIFSDYFIWERLDDSFIRSTALCNEHNQAWPPDLDIYIFLY